MERKSSAVVPTPHHAPQRVRKNETRQAVLDRLDLLRKFCRFCRGKLVQTPSHELIGQATKQKRAHVRGALIDQELGLNDG